MKRQTLAVRLAAALCAGALLGGQAAANETYRMNKFTFCGVTDTRSGVSVTVSSTAFSADGTRVAVATDNRLVRICDTATGREIASLAVPTSRGSDDDMLGFIAFSPDGARLVTASGDRMVRLWDIASRRALATLEHPSQVGSVTISRDGARIATSTRDREVRIWDAATGREIAELKPPSPVTSAAFSSDGSRLVTACWEGTVHVWDAATGREIATLNGHQRKATAARFSPNGAHVVTAAEDNTARVFDAASGRALHVLKHPSRVLSVAFSPDGTRIVTGAGREGRIFDAASGREIAVLKGHETEVGDAAFSPDGTRVVTGADDRSTRIYDAASGGEITVLKSESSGGYTVTVAFGPDSQRIFTVSGVEGIMWTKLAAASLPKDITGVWFGNFGPPNEPAEIKRERCTRNPIKINGDGLIVFYEVSSSDPPQATFHMRCASDLTCQVFVGAPGQGLNAQASGTLAVSGNAGKLCLATDCQPIARCPIPKWTEQERKSGLAGRWEAELRP